MLAATAAGGGGGGARGDCGDGVGGDSEGATSQYKDHGHGGGDEDGGASAEGSYREPQGHNRSKDLLDDVMGLLPMRENCLDQASMVADLPQPAMVRASFVLRGTTNQQHLSRWFSPCK
jgi:hypothetical protein